MQPQPHRPPFVTLDYLDTPATCVLKYTSDRWDLAGQHEGQPPQRIDRFLDFGEPWVNAFGHVVAVRDL